MLLQKLSDRFVLQPTRHPLQSAGKQRFLVDVEGHGAAEVWHQRVGCDEFSNDAQLFVLKFQGTGGRAERSTYHPLDYWGDLTAEMWSVNPPGYGGSVGKASMRNLAPTAHAVFRSLQRRAAGRPILIMGNSLGTVSALYLAAREPVAGLVLRNPPPLRHLIVGRYGWWNFGVGAWLVAQGVPRDLCAVDNASRVQCPGVVVSSQEDRVVPSAYQQRIVDAYSGPLRMLPLEDADHADPLTLQQQRRYQECLMWLKQSMQLSSSDLTTHRRESAALPPAGKPATGGLDASHKNQSL